MEARCARIPVGGAFGLVCDLEHQGPLGAEEGEVAHAVPDFPLMNAFILSANA
jgi:hypothetical protein